MTAAELMEAEVKRRGGELLSCCAEGIAASCCLGVQRGHVMQAEHDAARQ